ncbi:hypothetical protein [Pseudobdellovibrio exovorus]|uniref:Uncharacterized protein n=1 Tax=Pseudobdellovibrio exovorus JSS TaxID=1184267 RepID=M4VAU4_9BACT|nr:hypothetical protein [Pseudobdellovibrio exovorus]AGH96348.1 hypothetical protein A11Q_2132 [Pseudobdellovibrio exovorus JSS]
MKNITISFISLFFMFQSIAFAFNDKKTNPLLTDNYIKICSSGTMDPFVAKDEVEQLLIGLISTVTKVGQIEQLNKAQALKENLTKMSFSERILAANILMMARSNNLKEIRQFLSFSSENRIIESYRMYYDGVLDSYMGNLENGYKQIELAIDNLPFIDEGMILSLISLAIKLPEPPNTINKSLSLINNLQDSNPMKYLLLANKEMFLYGWESKSSKITELIQKAYQLCPKDIAVVFSFAAIEDSHFKIELAKDLYLEISSDNVLYYPEIDVRLLQYYYYDAQDMTNAKIYLTKSQASWPYLTIEDKNIVKEVTDSLEERSFQTPYSNVLVYISVPLIGLILGLIVFIKRFKKHKNT